MLNALAQTVRELNVQSITLLCALDCTALDCADLGVQQQPGGEGSAALSGALCALAEAHMHDADVRQAGPQVEALLQEALQLGASLQPLQVDKPLGGHTQRGNLLTSSTTAPLLFTQRSNALLGCGFCR